MTPVVLLMVNLSQPVARLLQELATADRVTITEEIGRCIIARHDQRPLVVIPDAWLDADTQTDELPPVQSALPPDATPDEGNGP